MPSQLSADLNLLLRPCRTVDQLHRWIRLFTGLSIPRSPVCADHSAPFDYIRRAYFEPGQDQVVWAPRGGGKTRLAALATLLDLLHKPGCAVRILGGSLEQSLRMWEHLLPDLERFGDVVSLPTTRAGSRVLLRNGSGAAVLTQSERAVRGLRVQKLRCDEVELFKPQIWQAAQLVTRSKKQIRGTVEAISTHHQHGGLMGRIIDAAETRKTPVVRWCLMEVLERCPAQRDCKTCPLWDECQGVAKTRCDGFFSIDDAIAMKSRVGVDTWQSEMLCRRPSTHASVFPRFDKALHLRSVAANEQTGTLSLAIDFGFHNPFVCLWVSDDGRHVHVMDEYVQAQRTIHEHVEHLEARACGKVARICCDPAGGGRNDQTAESNIAFLRRRGYRVCAARSRIVEGLEQIRSALTPALGAPTLSIDPRCVRLSAALQSYRYPDDGGELPIKDGTHDHLIDSLRYFYINRTRGEVTTRGY